MTGPPSPRRPLPLSPGAAAETSAVESGLRAQGLPSPAGDAGTIFPSPGSAGAGREGVQGSTRPAPSRTCGTRAAPVEAPRPARRAEPTGPRASPFGSTLSSQGRLTEESNRDWLARHPFTLVLSGGFFGFFAHTGLLSALEAADLKPARIVGSSAGALAGGLWAAGLPAATLEAALVALRREQFWDPGLPLGGLLKGELFSARLLELLEPAGITTIEACRIPFAPVVHDVWAHKAVTLERGPLDLAIRASCCVPALFRPVRIDGRLYVDGGVTDRPGLHALRPGERAMYHHLASHRAPRRGLLARAGVRLADLLTGAWAPAVGSTAFPALGPDVRPLIVHGLPFVSPFHLHRGRDAIVLARERTASWLEEPVITEG